MEYFAGAQGANTLEMISELGLTDKYDFFRIPKIINLKNMIINMGST